MVVGFIGLGRMVWSARRYPMTALLLDDTVLLACGIDAAGPLASAETYDPNSGAFVRTASMSVARSLGTATRLATGQVLVAGGLGASFLAGADRYDPPSASFAATGSLNAASALQTATLLDTREVLVAGGLGAGARSEVYDPVSGVFTLAPSMAVARSRQTATLLPDGTVARRRRERPVRRAPVGRALGAGALAADPGPLSGSAAPRALNERRAMLCFLDMRVLLS